MKSKKDNWQDEVMQSIEGILQAAPDEGLWTKLENRLMQQPFQIKLVSKPKLWAAAASIIFLLGINMFIITQNRQNKRDNTEILIDAYQLNNNPEIQLP